MEGYKFTWESNNLVSNGFIRYLRGRTFFTERKSTGKKTMWGFERKQRIFKTHKKMVVCKNGALGRRTHWQRRMIRKIIGLGVYGNN